MKINWFKINNKILFRFFYETYESLTQNSLIRLFIYLNQGYKCKDCSRDCGLCDCNYCSECKRNFCICEIKYIFLTPDKMELFISNLAKKMLNIKNIINIRNTLLKSELADDEIMESFKNFGL